MPGFFFNVFIDCTLMMKCRTQLQFDLTNPWLNYFALQTGISISHYALSRTIMPLMIQSPSCLYSVFDHKGMMEN